MPGVFDMLTLKEARGQKRKPGGGNLSLVEAAAVLLNPGGGRPRGCGRCCTLTHQLDALRRRSFYKALEEQAPRLRLCCTLSISSMHSGSASSIQLYHPQPAFGARRPLPAPCRVSLSWPRLPGLSHAELLSPYSAVRSMLDPAMTSGVRHGSLPGSTEQSRIVPRVPLATFPTTCGWLELSLLSYVHRHNAFPTPTSTSMSVMGPKEKLDNTCFAQPALFVAGLAAVEVLRSTDPSALSRCVAADQAIKDCLFAKAFHRTYESAVAVRPTLDQTPPALSGRVISGRLEEFESPTHGRRDPRFVSKEWKRKTHGRGISCRLEGGRVISGRLEGVEAQTHGRVIKTAVLSASSGAPGSGSEDCNGRGAMKVIVLAVSVLSTHVST
eukprot:gene5515-4146_t